MFRATTTQLFSFPSPSKTLISFQKIPKFSISMSQKSKAPKMAKPGGEEKRFWLLKTEPGEWSWEDQAANGGATTWDGVKNKQAQNNLKSMALRDLCFFYHSGAKSRRVVGVVAVVRELYDGDKGGAVDVEAVGEMRRPVDLKEMKGDGGLKGFALLRQPRLSVVPVPADVWARVCEMGGGFHGDGGVELEGDGDDGDEE